MENAKKLAMKAMLLGLGLGVVAKENAERFAKELLKKGEANEKQVRALAKKVIEDGKKKEKYVRSLIERETKRFLATAEKAADVMKKEYEADFKKLKAKAKIVKKKRKR